MHLTPSSDLRPNCLFRWASTLIDLSIIGAIAVLTDPILHILPWLISLILLAYYVCFERYCGRTPGKFLFLMCYEHTPLSWKKILMRNALRILLFPIASLSWKRVTLLDLLSGIRLKNYFIKR